jgi:hypothetical protein
MFSFYLVLLMLQPREIILLISQDFAQHAFSLQKGGGTIDLEPRLRHTSAVEPTIAPAAVERTITTRAAASVVFIQSLFFLSQHRSSTEWREVLLHSISHFLLVTSNFVLTKVLSLCFIQNALRQQRFVREVTIGFNLCNEPW